MILLAIILHSILQKKSIKKLIRRIKGSGIWSRVVGLIVVHLVLKKGREKMGISYQQPKMIFEEENIQGLFVDKKTHLGGQDLKSRRFR